LRITTTTVHQRCGGTSLFLGHLFPVRLFLALLLIVVSPSLFAQAPTALEAQEAQRARERERILREQMELSPDVRLPDGVATQNARLPAKETPCFTINHIQLVDETGHFAWSLAVADPPDDPASGRCLGSEGINRVMARIQNAIIARGYVTTRVLAEEQDLSSGALTLRIIPGRLRAIRFAEGVDTRANAWNAFPLRSGDLLNLRDLEQGLENLKRLPTVDADIQIVPGEKQGDSDVIVTWKQAFPFRLTLSANDGGSKSTGKYQSAITVSADHLLALNDLFYFNYGEDMGGADKGSSGTRSHTWHYAIPCGDWLLAFTANDYAYRQAVAGLSQTYLYRGKNNNQEIKLTRLVYRDARQKTALSLRGYLNQSNNYINDTEVEVQRRRMAGWELSADYRLYLDALPGATVNANLAWRQGTGAFDALPAPEESFGEGTARPRLWLAEANFNAPFSIFGQRLTYTGVWRGQWNRTPLVPQDRFSIGGRYTVRGFDGETILSAERGWLIRNDLAAPLGDSGQQLYIGLDHGEVGGQTAKLLLGRNLSGAALGLRGGGKGVFYDIFAGKALAAPKGFPTNHFVAGFNLTLSY
jgi:hemolysin activation/secretion protein